VGGGGRKDRGAGKASLEGRDHETRSVGRNRTRVYAASEGIHACRKSQGLHISREWSQGGVAGSQQGTCKRRAFRKQEGFKHLEGIARREIKEGEGVQRKVPHLKREIRIVRSSSKNSKFGRKGRYPYEGAKRSTLDHSPLGAWQGAERFKK